MKTYSLWCAVRLAITTWPWNMHSSGMVKLSVPAAFICPVFWKQKYGQCYLQWETITSAWFHDVGSKATWQGHQAITVSHLTFGFFVFQPVFNIWCSGAALAPYMLNCCRILCCIFLRSCCALPETAALQWWAKWPCMRLWIHKQTEIL